MPLDLHKRKIYFEADRRPWTMEERIYGLRSIVRRPNSKLGLHLSENTTIISLAHLGAWRSPASALAWGARGRRFKSSRPDREYEKPSLPGTVLFLTCLSTVHGRRFPIEGLAQIPLAPTESTKNRPCRGRFLFLTLTCNKVVPVEGGLNFQAKQKDIQVQK